MISIIVPVYNAEKYIHRCIDSILNQTYKDLEVIMVDDGSPDRCGIICDEYAQKDSRIKVIHQKNRGVSIARQAGLDIATGDYITHVDPDDWIEKNTIEELYDCAENNQADMVVYDFCKEYDGGSFHDTQDIQNPIDNYSILRKNIRCENVCITLCNSFVKRSTILKYNISFRPNTIYHGEDTLFISRLMLNNIKIVYINKDYYHYNYSNTESITRTIKRKNIISRRIFINVLENEIVPHHKDDLFFFKRDFLFNSFFSKNFDLLKSYPEIHNRIISERPSYSFTLPRSSSFYLALKGYPRFAYLLYHINNWGIEFWHKIKTSIKSE